MLIEFRTEAAGDFHMFAKPALRLIEAAGHSPATPGAIQAADLPQAIERLEQAVSGPLGEAAGDDPSEADADEPRVTMGQRAVPLLNMLKRAAEEEVSVLWDEV